MSFNPEDPYSSGPDAIIPESPEVIVARDPSTPVEKLIELSKDDGWQAKAAIAENPSTPADLLKEMSRNSDEAVRSYVARNPRTPRGVMEALALDESEYVRDFLAKNPALPVDDPSPRLADVERGYLELEGLRLPGLLVEEARRLLCGALGVRSGFEAALSELASIPSSRGWLATAGRRLRRMRR